MTTIPSDVYQGAGALSEEEKTDLVPATAGEVAKYFNAVPAQNKRLRGHDVSRRSTPGDPTNEDTRVLMAFVKALYNALFTGEWADPNTLELASSGKIRVKDVYVAGNRAPDVNNGNAFYLIEKLPETVKAKVAGFLKSGGGLSFDTNGELQVDFQDLTVDQLTPLCDPEGGIIVNDDEGSDGYGKLKIDFASMDPAIMRAVVYAMTQQGGGLSVDENGQLFVDFDSMPTDKFEAMLKAIHVPIWIEGRNNDTEFYVDDTNGVDSEGPVVVNDVTYQRGRSTTYPWKTLPYATQTICKNYNINSKRVHINIAGGTYNTEKVALPLQQRTTGEIQIRPYSGATVNVVMSLSGGTMFEHSGGVWRIQDMNLKLIAPEQTHTAGTAVSKIVVSTDSTGMVDIDHCNLEFEDNSLAAASGVRGGVAIHPVVCDGGHIRFYNNAVDSGGTPVASEYETTWSGTKVNAEVDWLGSTNGGLIELSKPGSSAAGTYVINVEGSFDTFYRGSFRSIFRQNGSGGATTFVATNVTGQRYVILGGGVVATGVGASNAETFFPGDTSGTVETATYSWIS